jgi:Tfp pilus assembly protein PilO
MNLQRSWCALKAWGWPGAVAVAILALAASAAGYAARCLKYEAAAVAQVNLLDARIRNVAKVQGIAPVQTRADWLASLPEADARQRRLADLLEISIREGLNSTRTEHQLSVDQAVGLERLRVTMPIQGSYAQIRQFIGAALAHDPALSLDSLRLRRPSPQSNQVEAELVWSMHAQSAQENP